MNVKLSDDGFVVELFIEKPNERLICGICMKVLNNPHQCKNGHCFCLQCLSRAIFNSETCPVCKVAVNLNSLSSNLFVKQTIEELMVSCECGWTGEQHKLASHQMLECDAQLANCSNFKERNRKCFCFGRLLSRKPLFDHYLDLEKLDRFKTRAIRHSIQIASLKAGSHSYSGHTKNGVTHGEGSMLLADGSVYFGEWLNGARTGLGVMWRDSKQYYMGSFVRNYQRGNGRFVMGDVQYCGGFVDDEFSGDGRLWDAAGDTEFTGYFKRGLKQGAGSMRVKKDFYEGFWVDDALMGSMRCTYPSSNYFAGQLGAGGSMWGELHSPQGERLYWGAWVNGQRHGMGRRLLANGTVYTGQWKCNKRHGKGIVSRLNSCDRLLYDGDWQAEVKRNGDQFPIPDGDLLYNGDWQDDMMHGHGRLITLSGNQYTGGFESNLRSGHGEEVELVGDNIYTGEWSQDQRHGQGHLKFANGDSYIGDNLDTWRMFDFDGFLEKAGLPTDCFSCDFE